jgi:Fic family protein
MSEKEWAVKYTDETYLSKNELIDVMHTSLVDGYWTDILSYRGKHAIRYAFRTINNHSFFLVSTDAVGAKIAEASNKLDQLGSFLKKNSGSAREKEQAYRECKLLALTKVNAFEGTPMSELSLKALLNKTYAENNPAHAPIINYLLALDSYLEKTPVTPNDDFLAASYGMLLGESDLTKFYRNFDFDGSARKNRFVIGGIFDYAPCEMVDPLMSEFLLFLENPEAPAFVKAVAALYFLDYVKPFERFNDELGALLAKAVLAQSDGSACPYLYPLECVLHNDPRYEQYALETQKSGDLTYLVLYAAEVLSPLIDKLIDTIRNLQIETFRNEFKTLNPLERQVAEQQGLIAKNPSPSAPATPQQMSIFEDAKPVANPTPSSIMPVYETPLMPSAQSAPVAEKPQPQAPMQPVQPAVTVAPAPMISPAPAASSVSPAAPMASPSVPAPAPIVLHPMPVQPQTPAAEVKKPLPQPKAAVKAKPAPKPEPLPEAVGHIAPGELAIGLPERELSDKEVKEYVQYLLESNPRLNRNQASFLANHCTVGHYYTIQQFKKFTHCAYETARTSMDKLVSEHYYKKEQVKNKFVYTPLRQGEKA